jgi:hypothetical protein
MQDFYNQTKYPDYDEYYSDLFIGDFQIQYLVLKFINV